MLKQQLNLKLSQKLSPQQIQLMKLIQLPTLSFEQKLHRELEENPALESGKEILENEDADNPQEEEREIIETDDINIDEYLSDDEIPASYFRDGGPDCESGWDEMDFEIVNDCEWEEADGWMCTEAVSYTHLTLPTILLV